MTGAPPLAPVVVVVDRGGSGAAVRYGASEALRTGRPLRLVHVAPPGDSWLEKVGRDSLRLALTRADAEVIGRVPVRVTSLQGGLPETVHLTATAAMVLLEQLDSSSHRRPTETPAAALAAATDTPLVVVPSSWVERHRGVVTVGLDPEALDAAAVRAGIAMARLRHAALRVVVGGPVSRAEVADRLAQLGGDACDVAIELVPGSTLEALQAAATSSDLLVLGRHRPQHPDGSRLGDLGRELLGRLVCPVLLTAPGHIHQTPAAAGATTPEEEYAMYARVGDRIVIRSTHLGGPVRDGEVIEVEHAGGRPPYRVRWSDTGHESLFFPGPDAYVDRAGPSYEPEYDVAAQVG